MKCSPYNKRLTILTKQLQQEINKTVAFTEWPLSRLYTILQLLQSSISDKYHYIYINFSLLSIDMPQNNL